MKKIWVAFVAVMLCVSALALTACIPSDYSKAAENWKDKGYTTTAYSGQNTVDSIALAAAQLSVESAIDMKGDLTAFVSASKRDGNDSIVGSVYYFEEADDAKAYFNYCKNHVQDGQVVKKSGKAVFVGSKKAYSDM